MAIYVLRCAEGHVCEVIQSFTAPLPLCRCGATTSKVPSTFGFAGRASTPPPPDRMPQTWRGTYNGDREYLTSLQRSAERRRAFEQRHPETAGDHRPIVAHEGRYEAAPLRKGDPVLPGAPGGGHPHGHDHAHNPGNGHGHEHSPDDGNSGGAGQGHRHSHP